MEYVSTASQLKLCKSFLLFATTSSFFCWKLKVIPLAMELQTNSSNRSFPNSSPQSLLPQVRIISYSFLLFWSFIGNALVIAVVYLNKHLRTTFNYLIVNMAVSDLFFPLIVLPLQIVSYTRDNPSEWLIKGPLGNALCKLTYILTDISPAVSSYSLVIIAFNRFFAIAYPVRRISSFHRKKDLFLIGLTWLGSCVLFSPYLYIFRLIYDEKKKYPLCIISWEPAFDNKTSQDIFAGIVIVAVFLIPFAIITTLYSIVIYKIVKASKRAATMMNRKQTLLRQKKNKQIFYLSITIVVGYAVLWGPLFSYLFVFHFIWHSQIPFSPERADIIHFLLQFLGYSTSVFNPTVYFVFFQNYRQGLKKILNGRRRRRRRRTRVFSQAYRLSRLSVLTDSINAYLSKKRRPRSMTSCV